jgi:hypothetical protein
VSGCTLYPLVLSIGVVFVLVRYPVVLVLLHVLGALLVAHTQLGFSTGVNFVVDVQLVDTPGVKDFCLRVDEYCASQLKSTFGLYNDPNVSILSPLEMRRMTNEWKKRLPSIYERYMVFFGFRHRINASAEKTSFFVEQGLSLTS